MSSSQLLIKGYLPVRLKLPGSSDETFLFVKEHVGAAGTVFVSNCPVIPGVHTSLLLKSIFGRYGDISRVTCIKNPRYNSSKLDQWTTKFNSPSFNAPHTADGKFAHIVFDDAKHMKQALKSLTNAMESEDPALIMDTIEIQTLGDETDRQMREKNRLSCSNEIDQDEIEGAKKPSGVQAVADRYRTCTRLLSRDILLAECNAVMESFEDEETEEQRIRESTEPDDDGFITVSYGASNSSKRELEGDQRGRKSGAKRQRKKKNGAAPLKDFYRFQTKETRKKSLQELRERFEDDLKRVKESRKMNRPFL